jgi:transglutaminase-like putative cysteine protease
MEMIYRDYFYDHPENFYLKNASLKYVYNQAGNTKEYESYTLLLSYSYDKNTVAGMRSRMGSALAGMLASAGGKSGDLAKERALHDALVGAVRYDTAAAANPASNPVSFTAYGALVNGSAVCDGYAKAMKLLLDSAGIKSLYVSGTATNDGGSSPHAWDMAQVSGKWYYLDPTFDDPVFYNDKGQVVNKSAIYHTYFNFISNPDHTLGTFDAADPDSADSENYQQMPAAG